MADEPVLSGGPEDIRRKLQAMAQDAQTKAERFGAVRRELASAVIEEDSPDGVVHVGVRTSGALTDLRLSERARELSPPQIAALVMSTVARAQGRIAQRARQAAEDNGVGADPATATMVGRLAEEFPQPETAEAPSTQLAIGRIEDEPAPPPPPAETPKAAPPRPRPQSNDDDEGFDEGQSFMQRR